MHPFGGTPICPRCAKAVYAAEQIMGPGRKLYHKPCLSCITCGKRLDSLSLLEHDQEPYCKNCHVKNFGNRDLRFANLPDRNDAFLSPPTSPSRQAAPLSAAPQSARSGPPLPVRRNITGTASPQPPILRATRALSPVRATFADGAGADAEAEVEDELESGESPERPSTPPGTGASSSATHVGRVGGLPRTVPLSPTKSGRLEPGPDAPAAAHSARLAGPLLQTSTGTRYGAALGGAAPLAPTHTGRQWGGGGSGGGNGGPACPRCGKTVFFAEQVRAIGKTYHRACLRCEACGTSLASGRLTEREGLPYCPRCYSKLYGPQGSGYALLGKAGS